MNQSFSLSHFLSQVKYVEHVEDYLPLEIDLDQAINKEEVAKYEAAKKEKEAKGEKMLEVDVVRPIIPYERCYEAFLAESQVKKKNI